MDGLTLEKFLRRDKKCSSMFLGVFASDRLPTRIHRNKPSIIVCNTDRYGQPGIHWVVLYIESSTYGEFFDSFGRAPDIPFRTFLHRHCSSWIYTGHQLQSISSRYCGHYCIFYAMHRCRGYNVNAVCNMFSSDTGLNDFLTHRFVCKMYQ